MQRFYSRAKQATLMACLAVGSCFTASSLNAQIVYNDNYNHAYNNTLVVDVGGMSLPPGYVISTTNDFNGVAPALLRIDQTGAILWEYNYWHPELINFRQTHTEVVDYQGQLAFLSTGSCEHVDNPGVENAYLSLVDEFGNPMFLGFYNMNSNYDHSVGLHCIQASDGYFILVGGLLNAFSTNSGKASFFLRTDINLNMTHYMAYESSDDGVNDYDLADHVIETDNPTNFFISGMCNAIKGGTGYPGVMAIDVDLSSAPNVTLAWDASFVLDPNNDDEDIAASAVYDDALNEIWLLANNRNNVTFNLTQLDASSGAILGGVDYSPGVDQYYGFDLMFSNTDPDNLVVAGWADEPSNQETIPFMVEYNRPSNTIVWQYNYPAPNAGYTNYFENQFLAPYAGKVVPYFTPSIADWRVDPFGLNGYVLVGCEDVGTYSPREIGVAGGGMIPCPFDPLNFSDSYNRTVIAPIFDDPIYPELTEIQPHLKDDPHIDDICGPIDFTCKTGGDHEAFEDAEDGELLFDAVSVFPNPNNGSFTLEVVLTSDLPVTIELMDIVGQSLEILHNGVIAAPQLQLEVADPIPGTYFLRITQNNKVNYQQVVLTR